MPGARLQHSGTGALTAEVEIIEAHPGTLPPREEGRMNAPLRSFQQFQMAGRRRDPRARRARPASARRMAVHEALLFNNITGFLDTCFCSAAN